MKPVHNPAKLSPEQVNPPVKRYRLLDEDEIGGGYVDALPEIERLEPDGSWTACQLGAFHNKTYRTTLTRSELAKARRKAK